MKSRAQGLEGGGKRKKNNRKAEKHFETEECVPQQMCCGTLLGTFVFIIQTDEMVVERNQQLVTQWFVELSF